jgi:hypothetical protein
MRERLVDPRLDLTPIAVDGRNEALGRFEDSVDGAFGLGETVEQGFERLERLGDVLFGRLICDEGFKGEGLVRRRVQRLEDPFVGRVEDGGEGRVVLGVILGIFTGLIRSVRTSKC